MLAKLEQQEALVVVVLAVVVVLGQSQLAQGLLVKATLVVLEV